MHQQGCEVHPMLFVKQSLYMRCIELHINCEVMLRKEVQ